MSVFSKLKQIQDLRSQAKKIEGVLGQEKVEVDSAGGKIKLTMTGKLEVANLSIDPSMLEASQKTRLEEAVKDAFNNAVHKTQKIMASKIQDMGGLDIPSLK